jgi:outer membrane protein OmpA-like peptidoglycan-associated protein
MKLRNLLLGTAIALCSTGAANAAITTPTGWYVSLGAGANWIEDNNVNWASLGSPTGSNFSYSWDTGYAVLASVGYDFGNHWRAELEATYRRNRSKSACSVSGSCFDPDNSSEGVPAEPVWELSQMVNVLYDFQLGGNWSAAVGAGVGGNLVVFEDEGKQYDDYVFAGQLIGELGYQFADRWQAFATYHYVLMEDPSFGIIGPFSPNTMDKTEHTVALGIRFDLQRDGTAPPPPAPTPEPVKGPKQFIVFFGFNKSNLTPEAARVVSDAAAAAKEYGSASIMVVGHTDTSGSDSYNMALSMRRAQAVKDGLASNGVPASMVSTSGRGESELMVQTGNGVKEPQNRRATIDLN